MVTIINHQSIFDSTAQTLVNTVNCVGVMGKGLALEFKKLYPEMFEQYKMYCNQKLIQPGKLWLYKHDDKHWVLNFPTKCHWKYPSKIEYIEQGLQKFVNTYKEKNITDIAFPLLGCNNGGLNPNIVINIMIKYLQQCTDCNITIYDNR